MLKVNAHPPRLANLGAFAATRELSKLIIRDQNDHSVFREKPAIGI